LFAVASSSKAQSEQKSPQKPQKCEDSKLNLKPDTVYTPNNFLITPTYSAQLGAPVKIPNGYKPSDGTVFNMPVAKINPVKLYKLPAITIKKVTEAP
jgi:hypothetical protein